MATSVQNASLSAPPDSKPRHSDPSEVTPRRGYSFWMKVVLFSYGLVSIAGWVRMIGTLVNWNWLIFAGVWPGPLYLAVTGGLWGVAGMVAVIWLWMRREWTRKAAFGVALFLAVIFWADRLMVAPLHPYGNNNMFAAIMTLLGLLFAWVVLQPLKRF